MSERNNEIVYCEGFHTAKNQIEPDAEPVAVDEQEIPEIPRRPFPVILTAQLVVSILIALTVFLLSITGSGLYDNFRSWYKSEMKKTLISDSVFRAVDLPSMFSASTADEVSP